MTALRTAERGGRDSAAATLGQVFDREAARLRTAGVADGRRDARLLIAAALGTGPEVVLGHPERTLEPGERVRIEALIGRRVRREPVSRILERREFWSLTFRLTPDVLDPRPDSETLVEAVLRRLPGRDGRLRILDLGTGSGCLLLALLAELPKATGLGTDASVRALDVARENAQNLGLSGRARFEQRNWAGGLDGAWQVIVSNPPYIKDRDMADLAPEVARYDPEIALRAGPDGLAAYREVLPQAAGLLDPEGIVALEVGIGQQDAVEALIGEVGLAPLGRARDMDGRVRCVLAVRA